MATEAIGPEDAGANTYVLLDPRDFHLGDMRIIPLIPKDIYQKAILKRIIPFGEVSSIRTADFNVGRGLNEYGGEVPFLSITPVGSIMGLYDRQVCDNDLEKRIEREFIDLKNQPWFDHVRFPLRTIAQLIAGYELMETAMYLVRLKLKNPEPLLIGGEDIQRDIKPKKIKGDNRAFRLNYSYIFACAPCEEGIEFQGGCIRLPHAKGEWAGRTIFPDGTYYPPDNRIDDAEVIKIGTVSLPRHLLISDLPIIDEDHRCPNNIVYNGCSALVLFDRVFPTEALTRKWLMAKKTQHFYRDCHISARLGKGEFRDIPKSTD